MIRSLIAFVLCTVFSVAHGEVTDISPAEAQKLLASPNPPIVIDIRTESEFKKGHIPGAVNINYFSEDFQAQLAKLKKDKTYIFHCKSGGRSSRSIATFNKLGFKKLLHLKAGYDQWPDKK